MGLGNSTCWVLLIMTLVIVHCNASPLFVNQVDVCHRHSSGSASTMPSMSLSVSKTGLCTLASRLMPSGKPNCPVSNQDPVMVLKFPCKQTSRSIAATGPALNVWSSITGSAPANSQHYGLQNLCKVSTLHPSLSFRRIPSTYYFGYQVSGLPCSVQPATPALLPNTGATATSSNYAISYGLWLVPSLKFPPHGYSKANQRCEIAVLLADKAYLSTTTYPCNLLEWTSKQTAALGQACCYGAI